MECSQSCQFFLNMFLTRTSYSKQLRKHWMFKYIIQWRLYIETYSHIWQHQPGWPSIVFCHKKAYSQMHWLCQHKICILFTKRWYCCWGTNCRGTKNVQEAQNIFPSYKNINPLISSNNIKRNIEEKYQISWKIQRYHSYKNKKPFPIISIETEKINSKLFLKEGILLFNQKFLCEACKQPIICCFHCQKFGHKWIFISLKIFGQTVGDQ